MECREICQTFHLWLKSLLQLLQTFATSTKSCDSPIKTMPLPATINGRDTPPLLTPSEETSLRTTDAWPGGRLHLQEPPPCSKQKSHSCARPIGVVPHHRFLAMGGHLRTLGNNAKNMLGKCVGAGDHCSSELLLFIVKVKSHTCA